MNAGFETNSDGSESRTCWGMCQGRVIGLTINIIWPTTGRRFNKRRKKQYPKRKIWTMDASMPFSSRAWLWKEFSRTIRRCLLAQTDCPPRSVLPMSMILKLPCSTYGLQGTAMNSQRCHMVFLEVSFHKLSWCQSHMIQDGGATTTQGAEEEGCHGCYKFGDCCS